jgi:hypothetical protein
LPKIETPLGTATMKALLLNSITNKVFNSNTVIDGDISVVLRDLCTITTIRIHTWYTDEQTYDVVLQIEKGQRNRWSQRKLYFQSIFSWILSDRIASVMFTQS